MYLTLIECVYARVYVCVYIYINAYSSEAGIACLILIIYFMY